MRRGSVNGQVATCKFVPVFVCLLATGAKKAGIPSRHKLVLTDGEGDYIFPLCKHE